MPYFARQAHLELGYWICQPWHSMAELWLRVVALHDADASSSFEQPPANLVVWAFAVHATQCQQTSQLSCSSRHLTLIPAPCCSSRLSRMGAFVLWQLPEHALSVPAFRLASPRFCTVTFCARLSLRLGMLFRFFCWRHSMLLGAVRYALQPAVDCAVGYCSCRTFT